MFVAVNFDSVKVRQAGARLARRKLRIHYMKYITGIALLVVGVVLLCMCYDSYHSSASNVSRVVTGTSTDKTLWLLIGGIVGTVGGLGGLLGGSKKA